ncbi:MAG: hypothetical protein H7222_09635 [Methylotenera sp.]|nr:hypothetical protein [Oligoflexia bacterium]
MNSIGSRRWIIPEGHIPDGGHGAGRTLHVRFNDLKEPEPIPLDTRQAESAPMTSVACSQP